jgi:uncharacterized protein (TIGR02284 family)
MQTATQTKDVLYDLVLINNDRIASYEKAIDELMSKNHLEDNSDLIEIFRQMIMESHDNRDELAQELANINADPASGTMTSGKLYRSWMDVKALFAGKSRQAILDACEGGEDAAQKAYDAAQEEDLTDNIRFLLQGQQEILKNSHNKIKMLRDMSE